MILIFTTIMKKLIYANLILCLSLIMCIPMLNAQHYTYNFTVKNNGQNRNGFLFRINTTNCITDTIGNYQLNDYDFAHDSYRGITSTQDRMIVPMKEISTSRQGLLCPNYNLDTFTFVPVIFPNGMNLELNDIIYDDRNNYVYSISYDNTSDNVYLLKLDFSTGIVSDTTQLPRNAFRGSDDIKSQIAIDPDSQILYFTYSNHSTSIDSAFLGTFDLNTNLYTIKYLFNRYDSMGIFSNIFYNKSDHSIIGPGKTHNLTKFITRYNIVNETYQLHQPIHTVSVNHASFDPISEKIQLFYKNKIYAFDLIPSYNTDSCDYSSRYSDLEFVSSPSSIQTKAEFENHIISGQKVLIYPVPANDFINISLTNEFKSNQYTLQIHDIMGSLIIESKISSFVNFSFPFPDGTYILSLYHKNNNQIIDRKLFNVVHP